MKRLERSEVIKKEGETVMKHIITATYKGRRIKRIAYSDLQAWTIVNILRREGAVDIGMREE